MKEELKKNFINMIKTDDLGQLETPGGDELPRPLANKVIEEIRQANILRRMFPSIAVPVSTRNLTIPVVSEGADINVYTVGYGADITAKTEQPFTTQAIIVTPRLLVSWVEVIQDDLETASIDLAQYVRKTLTNKIAEAEEKAMMVGVKDGGANNYLDIFSGIATFAAGSSCVHAAVTYVPATDDVVDKIMDAKKALGAYGNDAGKLVLLCSNTFGNRLRKNAKVYNVEYNPKTDVLESGTMPRILGIRVIEHSLLEALYTGECAILLRDDSFLLGIRKDIMVRQKEMVEKFSVKIIMAEEIDFVPQLARVISGVVKYDGVVLIKKAS